MIAGCVLFGVALRAALSATPEPRPRLCFRHSASIANAKDGGDHTKPRYVSGCPDVSGINLHAAASAFARFPTSVVHRAADQAGANLPTLS